MMNEKSWRPKRWLDARKNSEPWMKRDDMHVNWKLDDKEKTVDPVGYYGHVSRIILFFKFKWPDKKQTIDSPLKRTNLIIKFYVKEISDK